MAATVGGNLGLSHSWAFRESGWKTGNDANLLTLDGVVQLGVISNIVTAPPGGESDGDRWIIPAGATGAWSGKTDQVAIYVVDAYTYHTPKTGWVAYVAADTTLYVYSGAAWVAIAGGAGPLPAGTWDDPFVFASGAAYMWYDVTNSLMRLKPSVAPVSDVDPLGLVFTVG